MPFAKKVGVSVTVLYQLLQLLGLIAMLFAHWPVAVGAFIIVLGIYALLDISKPAKGTFAGLVGGAVAIWGWWIFPHFQPLGHILAPTLGVFLVLATIIVLQNGE